MISFRVQVSPAEQMLDWGDHGAFRGERQEEFYVQTFADINHSISLLCRCPGKEQPGAADRRSGGDDQAMASSFRFP